MTRRKKIYEGKAKILYEGPEPGTLIQYFKDDTTAFDATKKAVLEGLIEQVNEAIEDWPVFADEAGCTKATTERVRKALGPL